MHIDDWWAGPGWAGLWESNGMLGQGWPVAGLVVLVGARVEAS
jgi:hypothetical protein